MIKMKYNRWTLLKEVEPTIYSSRKIRNFLCKCDCGIEKIVSLSNITSGKSKSCGCFNIESIIKRNKIEKIKHSECIDGKISLTYITHKCMMNRCYYEKDKFFHNYGAKGIYVYEKWHKMSGFKKYLIESGLGLRPSKKYTIDRIDNKIGYFPGNIKWSTQKEQQNNRTNNKLNS